MVYYYTVVDKLTGEILHFLEQFDAEAEAERRLSMHLNGYNIRRNHIKPERNAVLKVENNAYVILKEDK